MTVGAEMCGPGVGLGPRLLVVAALTMAALVAYWWHTEREADRRWGERAETRDERGDDE